MARAAKKDDNERVLAPRLHAFLLWSQRLARGRDFDYSRTRREAFRIDPIYCPIGDAELILSHVCPYFFRVEGLTASLTLRPGHRHVVGGRSGKLAACIVRCLNGGNQRDRDHEKTHGRNLRHVATAPYPPPTTIHANSFVLWGLRRCR